MTIAISVVASVASVAVSFIGTDTIWGAIAFTVIVLATILATVLATVLVTVTVMIIVSVLVTVLASVTGMLLTGALVTILVNFQQSYSTAPLPRWLNIQYPLQVHILIPRATPLPVPPFPYNHPHRHKET